MPLVFLQTTDMQTITLVPQYFVGEFSNDQTKILASAVITAIPEVVAYLCLQATVRARPVRGRDQVRRALLHPIRRLGCRPGPGRTEGKSRCRSSTSTSTVTCSTASHEEIGNAIHEAQIEALDIPADDRFQVFLPHDAGEIKFDPGYNGVDRRSLLVIRVIAVHMYGTATKRAFFKAVVDRLAAARDPAGGRADLLDGERLSTTGTRAGSEHRGDCHAAIGRRQPSRALPRRYRNDQRLLRAPVGRDGHARDRAQPRPQRKRPATARTASRRSSPTSATTPPLAAAIGDRTFDAVVNFLSYDADDAHRMVTFFGPRTRQYVHISSGSIYAKPVRQVPISESTPTAPNPHLAYATRQVAGRAGAVRGPRVAAASRSRSCGRRTPTTTRNPPLPGGWTAVDRIARGEEIPVHGDGTSLWTLTHAEDFAQGLVGLLGNPRAIGETFNITGSDVLHLGPDLHHRRRRPRGRGRSWCTSPRRCTRWWRRSGSGRARWSATSGTARCSTPPRSAPSSRASPPADLPPRRDADGRSGGGNTRSRRPGPTRTTDAVLDPDRRRVPRGRATSSSGAAARRRRRDDRRRSARLSHRSAVTALCVGTSPLASMPDALRLRRSTEDRAVETVDAVLDSGAVNFIDTSNGYGADGAAERRIGIALRRRGRSARRHWCSPPRSTPTRGPATSPANGSASSLEESLDRLGVDHIQLLHLHDPERITFEEATAPGGPVDALVDLQASRVSSTHLGVAGGPVDLMRRYLDTGVFDVVLTHNRYTLLDRSAEALFADRARARRRRAQRGSLRRRDARQGPGRADQVRVRAARRRDRRRGGRDGCGGRPGGAYRSPRPHCSSRCGRRSSTRPSSACRRRSGSGRPSTSRACRSLRRSGRNWKPWSPPRSYGSTRLRGSRAIGSRASTVYGSTSIPSGWRTGWCRSSPAMP